MTDLAVLSEDLTKFYGKIRAVDGLDLCVRKSSVYGFIGRNGAGKTSTIRMLMGLVHPTRGSLAVMGIDPRRRRPLALERIGYVDENKVLFEYMTGRELVRFNKAFFPNWSGALVKKYRDRLEIPMDQAFGRLSLGNRTKICLLMALAQNSDLLVLDEPTLGLDPATTDEFLKILIEDFASEGRTILYSSHLLAEVERVADWVGIINRGRLVLQAQLENIRTEYRRIIVSGTSLPTKQTPEIISLTRCELLYEYIVSSNADRFVAQLRNAGATVVEVSSLSLSELFLHVVRREESCTLGNAGEIPEPVS